MRELVRRTFNHTIATAPINPELKQALKSWPTTKEFLKNLTKKLEEAERTLIKRKKKPPSNDTLRATIRDFAYYFIMGVNAECESRIRSDMERLRLEAQKQRELDLDKALKGEYVGEFEELKEFVQTDEKRT